MTTDLEKQFFDTFGIEPKCETRDEYHKYECYGMVDCDECAGAIYPQITDRILLELICILHCYYFPTGDNISELKECILSQCIRYKDEIKKRVQALFKEV